MDEKAVALGSGNDFEDPGVPKREEHLANRRWLGHASVRTTAINAQVSGSGGVRVRRVGDSAWVRTFTWLVGDGRSRYGA